MNTRLYGRFLTLTATVVLITVSAIAGDRGVDEPAKQPRHDPRQAHPAWAAASIVVGTAPSAPSDPMKPTPAQNPPGRTLWKWSLAAYTTANALDVASSLGPHYGRETNALLTNSTGEFHVGKAIAVKGSVLAVTGIAEYLIIRKWPQMTKFFSIVNFGWAGAETGIAAHNFRLRR